MICTWYCNNTFRSGNCNRKRSTPMRMNIKARYDYHCLWIINSGFGFLYPCLICFSFIFFLVKSVCCMQDNKLKLQPAPFWSIISQLLFFNCLLSVCLKKPNTNKSFNQSIGHSFKHREMVFLIGEPYKKCSNALSTK